MYNVLEKKLKVRYAHIKYKTYVYATRVYVPEIIFTL